MGKAEIQRKMEYFSVGMEQYRTERKAAFQKEFIDQHCRNMKLNPSTIKTRDPEYYKMILSLAADATDKMWDNEMKLIEKWEDQRKKICASVISA